jgi:hypothetical protein
MENLSISWLNLFFLAKSLFLLAQVLPIDKIFLVKYLSFNKTFIFS